jgi:GTP diphosphokinase / guanosine-3',5'-bis(diphosphate) 3'-diphosphatase
MIEVRIKLADKIGNVRSVAASPPVDWSNRRKREYIQFCVKVVNELCGTSPILEAEFYAAREIALQNVAD